LVTLSLWTVELDVVARNLNMEIRDYLVCDSSPIRGSKGRQRLDVRLLLEHSLPPQDQFRGKLGRKAFNAGRPVRDRPREGAPAYPQKPIIDGKSDLVLRLQEIISMARIVKDFSGVLVSGYLLLVSDALTRWLPHIGR